ncbi:GNAT family N-acetyltransferase [Ectobacillus ponti]|uniref:GNAT family N-acetyltransferase n=1 Tax=Ectobacillus ponti TaxID=2961894 RepID=A0AA42BRH6_9BACI|nr:GNAT family protein [Ectobacillus ponti]MCP8967393.1 GNAT family N-acetyltransferase [Ectobacillus ponti]
MNSFYHLFAGTSVKLAAPREDDLEIMSRWQEDAEYLRNVDTDIALPKSKMQLQEDARRSSGSAHFHLRTIEDDRFIGFAVIHSIEWNNQTGMLAIGIGEAENRGKGYGSEALQLILRFAFHELNLHRVGLDVISYNKGAIRAYEKAGFRQEGCMREAVYRNGRRYDRLIMSILRPDWLAAPQ